MPGKMIPDEVNAFLDSRPGWIALTTLSKSGHPHTVPIGYFRMGNDVYIGCRAGTQKLKNIERNPRVSLMLEAGSTMQDIKGVCIQGEAEVILDRRSSCHCCGNRCAGVGRRRPSCRRRPGPGTAYIHVLPTKVISWHYAKQ